MAVGVVRLIIGNMSYMRTDSARPICRCSFHPLRTRELLRRRRLLRQRHSDWKIGAARALSCVEGDHCALIGLIAHSNSIQPHPLSTAHSLLACRLEDS
jgi:hypothetical protein